MLRVLQTFFKPPRKTNLPIRMHLNFFFLLLDRVEKLHNRSQPKLHETIHSDHKGIVEGHKTNAINALRTKARRFSIE